MTLKTTVTIFWQIIDKQVKATLHTIINTKVVQAMKKLQASYNNNANKIIEQAPREKIAIKLKNPRLSTKLGTILMQILMQNGGKQFLRSSPTWTSSRYGAWLEKVLCPLIADSWKTSWTSRSSAMVYTRHVLWHAGRAKYLVSTSPKTTIW